MSAVAVAADAKVRREIESRQDLHIGSLGQPGGSLMLALAMLCKNGERGWDEPVFEANCLALL